MWSWPAFPFMQILNSKPMKSRLRETLVASAIFALTMGGAASADTFVYDYDNGSVTGSAAGTNLAGQDGWVSLSGTPKVRNDIVGGGLGGNSSWGGGGTLSTQASRVNNPNWGYAINGPNIQLSMIVRADESTANDTVATFALGIDANKNGSIQGGGTDETAFQFGFRFAAFTMRGADFGTETNGATVVSGTEYWKLVLDVDLDANGGDGSGSLSAQYLGDTNGSFDAGKSTTLDPVATHQNVNLQISNMGANTDYTKWNGIYVRNQYNSFVDNLTISGDVVLPTTVFNGGDMLTAGSWTNGLPVAPFTGTSAQNGTFNDGGAGVADWLLTVTGGTITAGQDWSFTGGSNVIFAGGALNVTGDVLVNNGSIMRFDGGTIGWGGELGTGAASTGTVVINDGTFTGGVGSSFGSATGTGSIDINGGTVNTTTFDFSGGSASLGGDAVLSGNSATFGALDIGGDWSGSFTISGFSGTDWESQFTSGNVTVSGQTIDSTLFAMNFTLSNGGQTITRTNPPGTYQAVFNGKEFTVVEVDPFKSGEEPGGNTQRADGSGTFWANTSTSNTDNLWRQRDGFGYETIPFGSNRLFEASQADASNAPALRTSISGLSPAVYEVVMLYTSRVDGLATGDVGSTQGVLNGSIGDPGTETFNWQNADSPALGTNGTWGTYYGVVGNTGSAATGFTVDMAGTPAFGRSHVIAVAYRELQLTEFAGGDLLAPGNWSNGLPVSPVIGSSSQSGSFNDGGAGVADWLLTVSAGTITVGQDWHFTAASEITLDGGTLNVAGDVLVEGTSEMTVNDGVLDVAGNIGVEDLGVFTFNGGSISWDGSFDTGFDFESTIVINGGTFTGGGSSSFGNANGSGIMTINGGTISASIIDFSSNSSLASLGGNASISGTTGNFGQLDIQNGWTGTLMLDSFSGSDWENVFLSGEITFGGAFLDAPGFASTFFVSADGKSLSTEPFVTADPKLTVVGFNGSGDLVFDATDLDPDLTYTLKRGTDLIAFPDTVGSPITAVSATQLIDENPPAGKAFYRLEGQFSE